jgi:type II secretory pathway pseudopilin PulG
MQRVVTPRAAITGLALVVLLSLLSMAAAQQGAEQRQLQQQEQQLTNAAADVNSASGFYPATFNKPTPPPTEFDPSDPFTTRQTVYINLGGKKHTKTFPLRFPRLPPLPPGVPTYIRLNVTDTCGLFTLFHTVHQAEGAVVPPHIHYAEDEYFIVSGG